MIKDYVAYQKLCEKEHWNTLQQMTIEESISIGEALLTSEIMDIAAFTDDDNPACLAVSLGVKPDFS